MVTSCAASVSFDDGRVADLENGYSMPLIEYDEVVEELADLAHRQWSGWMKYLFRYCDFNEAGQAIIPVAMVMRWKRQMATLYSALPEDEKESDRDEARLVLETLRGLDILG